MAIINSNKNISINISFFYHRLVFNSLIDTETFEIAQEG